MRVVTRFSVCATGLAVLILSACAPKEEPSPGRRAEAPSEDAPVAVADAAHVLGEWKDCVSRADTIAVDAGCGGLANALAGLGGPPLQAALEQLADPNIAAHGKVMIVDGFKGRLSPDAASILKPMTEPGEDETTRACATALLASIPDLDLVPFLIALTQDPNPRVQFAALLGIVAAAPEGSEFRRQLQDMLKAPDTPVNMKEHIVRVFSQNPTRSDAEFLVAAIQDTNLAPAVRLDAAAALGRVGDEGAIEALTASITADASEEYRDTVDLSIAVIKERAQAEKSAGGGADPEEMPLTVKQTP